MNSSFDVGDIMLIEDHINLFPSTRFTGRITTNWVPVSPI